MSALLQINDNPLEGGNKYPKESEMDAYFGKIEIGHDGMPTERWERGRLTTISVPYPLRLSWDPDVKIPRVRCALAVANDLQSIFEEIWALFERDIAKVQKARMDLFGLAYSFSRKRGLHGLSASAYGAAICFDPERNGLGMEWKADKGMIPLEVIEIFKAHGWTWGGDNKKRPEPGHFQATS